MLPEQELSLKNPAPVPLYVGLGFVLMNIYVYIQWTYICIRRKGGRKPVPWTFKNMLRQITRKIDDEFGFVDWVPLSHPLTPPPISVILLKRGCPTNLFLNFFKNLHYLFFLGV